MSTIDIPSEVPQKTYSVTKKSFMREDGPSYVHVVTMRNANAETEFATVDPDGSLAFPSPEGYEWVSGTAIVKVASLMLFDSFGMEVAFEYCGAVGRKLFGFEISPFATRFEIRTSDLLAPVLEVRNERQQSVEGPQGFQGPVGYSDGTSDVFVHYSATDSDGF